MGGWRWSSRPHEGERDCALPLSLTVRAGGGASLPWRAAIARLRRAGPTWMSAFQLGTGGGVSLIYAVTRAESARRGTRPCGQRGLEMGGVALAPPGTGIAYDRIEMRGSVLLAAGLLWASAAHAQDADNTPRVLEVTLADLDEDSLDFLIGWERWKGDILDLASEGYARFTFVPLLAVEPGLPADGRFSGWILAASERRATLRRSRPNRPIRTARAPRDRTSDRGRPRPPRGLAPLGKPPRFAPPGPRNTGRAPARGPRELGAPTPRGGSRGGASGASTGRAPTGSAKPRGSSPRPRGPAAVSRSGADRRNPRPHR